MSTPVQPARRSSLAVAATVLLIVTAGLVFTVSRLPVEPGAEARRREMLASRSAGATGADLPIVPSMPITIDGVDVREPQRLVLHTVHVELTTSRFHDARSAVEAIAAEHHGAVIGVIASGSNATSGNAGGPRTLTLTVHVPLDEGQAALAAVRALGTVVNESQSTDDVTDSHRDLLKRIENAKREDARLTEVLTRRTEADPDYASLQAAAGKVATEVARMVVEEKGMRERAGMWTIVVKVQEAGAFVLSRGLSHLSNLSRVAIAQTHRHVQTLDRSWARLR